MNDRANVMRRIRGSGAGGKPPAPPYIYRPNRAAAGNMQQLYLRGGAFVPPRRYSFCKLPSAIISEKRQLQKPPDFYVFRQLQQYTYYAALAFVYNARYGLAQFGARVVLQVVDLARQPLLHHSYERFAEEV